MKGMKIRAHFTQIEIYLYSGSGDRCTTREGESIRSTLLPKSVTFFPLINKLRQLKCLLLVSPDGFLYKNGNAKLSKSKKCFKTLHKDYKDTYLI